MSRWWKTKKITFALVAMFVVFNIFGSFFIVRPVQAGLPVTVLSSQPDIRKEIMDQIYGMLLSSAKSSLINAASYFSRKLAKDAATAIISGGKGQGAQVFEDSFGSYLKTTALGTVGNAISKFSEPSGLNLCDPSDARTKLTLQVALLDEYGSMFDNAEGIGASEGMYGDSSGKLGAPDCRWNDFLDNLDIIKEMQGEFGYDIAATEFARSIDVQQSDFGVALSLMTEVDRQVDQATRAAESMRIEGQGFKPLTETVSDLIKTPAYLLQQEAEAFTSKHLSQLNAGQLGNVLASEEWKIIPTAISTFLNSVVGQLMNQILSDGLLSSRPGGSSGRGSISYDSSITDYAALGVSRYRNRGQDIFSFLITKTSDRSVSSYDVVSEFHSCPDNPGVYNCVMDDGLAQTIDRARTGDALSVREALEEGLLHGNWKLVSSNDRISNTNIQLCYNNAYCYSNLQKMRKVRILPLGFEIAAQKSPVDSPWTLKEVVDGFNNCPEDEDGDGIIVLDDNKYQFCHLIDPNWILKAPETRSESRIFGEQLFAEGIPDRKEEHSDVSTCLARDGSGTCIDYGYCTKEKNVWHLGGQGCPEYFSTCRTFVDNTGKANSYLTRSLDYGTCDIGSVGCRSYSTEIRDGEWYTGAFEDAMFFGVNRVSHKFYKEGGRPVSLYLNEKAKNYTNCSQENEGCSLFFEGDDGREIYLKKAPDYLTCYDVDTSMEMGVTNIDIDWPQNPTDLTRLDERLTEEQKNACRPFAQVCIPEEVGCESYTSQNDGTRISGVVGNNFCPSECVGYETFKKEETYLEPSEFPLYFVSNNGQTCSPQYVGCDEFTNIDEASRGGESLAYFSNLRYCERPDGENEKTYYSWEGSESTGYILKKHKKLQIDNDQYDYISSLSLDLDIDSILQVYPVGSPAYNDDIEENLEYNYSKCNAKAYNLLLHSPYDSEAASPDCRALYDTQGNIYYRLLTETVTVSEQCTPLRKTNSYLKKHDALTQAVQTQLASGLQEGELNKCERKGGLWKDGECQLCYDGGVYQSGSCIYWTIASESDTCPASANMCRSYIGNTGNNIQEMLYMSFEPRGTASSSLVAASEGWGAIGLSVEPEATQVGLYSLKLEGDATYTFESGELHPNGWYELSFWARGIPQGVSVAFYQDNNNKGTFTYDNTRQINIPVSITEDWREYKLGPVQFVGDPSQATGLRFDRNVQGMGSPYFIDNVRVTKVQDHIYLIKDSWKTREGYNVPLSCDSNPNDPFPGRHLGCEAYTSREGDVVSFSQFDRLCRQEAVGCTKLTDTYNSREPQESWYNIECSSANPEVCELGIVWDDGSQETLASCTPAVGKTSCYIKGPVTWPDGKGVDYNVNLQLSTVSFTESTVVILEDREDVYLTVDNDYICNSGFLGCQRIALEEKVLPEEAQESYKFTETFFLNNPAYYSEVLCSDEQIGCGIFKSDNEAWYFKDPEYTSSALCKYNATPININGVERHGWFMKDVGRCNNGSGKYCRLDDDCEGEAACVSKGLQPCYPDYLNIGGSYGLWSNDSSAYENYVGLCDNTAHLCTELIDPLDTSGVYEEGKPYYVVLDDELKQKSGECEGLASQREGCVLFNDITNPTKSYNTEATYTASLSQNNARVAPDTSSPRDSNLILKVDRDRECSEWLACKTYFTIAGENNTERRCAEYKPCVRFNEEGECLQWSDFKNNVKRLTQEEYINRRVDWYMEEYTGYSLFNKFPLSTYISVNIDEADPENRYLASEIYTSETCGRNGATCQNGELEGVCYDKKCLASIENDLKRGGVDVDKDEEIVGMYFNEQLDKGICKAHPEKDSPYSTSIAVKDLDDPKRETTGNAYRYDFTKRNVEYGSVNVCQDDSGKDCSCSYTKVEYKDAGTDYWPEGTSDLVIPDGVCQGGSLDGVPCQTDAACQVLDNSFGTCAKIAKKADYLGETSFCLEYDLGRPLTDKRTNSSLGYAGIFPCIMWLPVEVSASVSDELNMYPEAGYVPSVQYDAPDGNGGEVFCKESTGYGQGKFGLDMAYNNKGTADPFDDLNPGSSSGLESLNISNGDDLDQFRMSGFSGVLKYIDMLEEDGTTVDYKDWSGRRPENNDFSFDQAFDPDGKPNRTLGMYDINDVNNNNCPSMNFDMWTADYHYLDSYGSAICWADHNSENERVQLAKMMQLWGWKYIEPHDGIDMNPNIQLLRVDVHGILNDSGNSITSDLRGGYSSYVISNCNNKIRQIYSLAAIPNADSNYAGCDGFDNGSSYGTLLHPPRLWKPRNDYFYLRNDQLAPGSGTDTGGWKIETGFLSPEESHSLPGFYERQYLYRNKHYEENIPLESVLRESDIDQVYFVPIAYPGGIEGSAPGLLSTSFKIDFEDLQDIETPQKTKGIIYSGADSTFLDDENSNFYIEDRVSQEGGVYSYVLQKDKEPGINSFNNYERLAHTGAENGLWKIYTENLTDKDRERSEIYRRYVSVFYNTRGGTPGFSLGKNSGETDAPNGSGYGDDPFTTDCERLPAVNKDHGNWIAIGMDFNADGEFLGYISRYCNNVNPHEEWQQNTSAGIRFAIFAEMNDRCEEVVQMYDNDVLSSENTNKAWTDRVWNGSQWDGLDAFGYSVLSREDVNEPFGSMSIRSGDLEDINKVRGYSFGYTDDGVPRFCNSSDDKGVRGLDGTCDALLDHYSPALVTDINSIIRDGAFVENVMHQLYMKFFNIIKPGVTVDSFSQKTTEAELNSLDKTDPTGLAEIDPNNTTGPPQIYALNTDECDLGGYSGDCSAGPRNAITIDDTNEGMKHGVGSVPIALRFFAFADDNRMPIRRVMVDWGDGIIYNDGKYGLYKNMKPFCEENSSAGVAMVKRCGDTQLTCEDNNDCPGGEICSILTTKVCQGTQTACIDNSDCSSDCITITNPKHFGDLPRACKDKYFEFGHFYNCEEGSDKRKLVSELDVTEEEKNSLIQLEGVDEYTEVCQFTPRVQVLDNWGWCNGDCIGGNGCYDDDTKLCTDGQYHREPWTYYDGKIIVIPN